MLTASMDSKMFQMQECMTANTHDTDLYNTECPAVASPARRQGVIQSTF